MDEAESSLKALVHQMGEMILNLLSSLNISKFTDYSCQKVHILVFYLLLSFHFFDFETHIAANSSNTSSRTLPFISVEIAIHLHQGLLIRSKTHIQQNGKLRPEFLTEAIEEPVVGRQFSCIFVLHAHKQIHNRIFIFFLHLLFLIILILFTLALTFLQSLETERYFFSESRDISQILPGSYVVVTEALSFLKSLQNQRFSLQDIQCVVIMKFLVEFIFRALFFLDLFEILVSFAILIFS